MLVREIFSHWYRSPVKEWEADPKLKPLLDLPGVHRKINPGTPDWRHEIEVDGRIIRQSTSGNWSVTKED